MTEDMLVRVFKFRLAPELHPTIQVPTGAEWLHVGEQADELYVWALVDTKAPYETRTFTIVGTGWVEAAITGRHVGTVQMANGLVWHVFEGGGQ